MVAEGKFVPHDPGAEPEEQDSVHMTAGRIEMRHDAHGPHFRGEGGDIVARGLAAGPSVRRRLSAEQPPPPTSPTPHLPPLLPPSGYIKPRSELVSVYEPEVPNTLTGNDRTGCPHLEAGLWDW